MNLDETPVQCHPNKMIGNYKRLAAHARRIGNPTRQASSKDLRVTFTHVALICNKPELQPFMPQFIFVGNDALSWTQLSDLLPLLPDNVFLRRMARGWNNSEQQTLILKIIGDVAATRAPELIPVLLFDCSPIHLATPCLQACCDSRIWPLLVPAKMTFLLQPCDTHLFRKYKSVHRAWVAGKLLEGTDASIVKTAIIGVIHCIRTVLQGHDWNHAFAQDGFCNSLEFLSQYILSKLDMRAPPAISDLRPTRAMVQQCWPKMTTACAADVLKCLPADATHPVPVPKALPPPVHPSLTLPRSSLVHVPFGVTTKASSPCVHEAQSSIVPGVPSSSSAPSKAPSPPLRRLRSKTCIAGDGDTL